MVIGPHTSEKARRRARGAAAPEYALGVALLLVGSLGAIDAMASRAESNLAAHGASAGAPDLPDLGIAVTTSSTAPPPTTPETSPPPAPVDANAVFTSSDLGLSGSKWNPRVDVMAVDAATGDVLIGVTITVTWTEQPSGITTTQSCAVVSTGVCSFQLSDLRRSSGHPDFVDTVTVTVDSVVGVSPAVTYTPGSATLTLDADPILP